ncbi:MAG TPA: adenylate/guanylate cyclase domain-containing protein [Candidatus Didemnitutus sp.]|nr:adenylate/guanylate cyclase domain-containing protein [Candidatus Didemnitutus sp.]
MSGRILLIDDTPANIQAISTILKNEGYQITVATSGQQGLELLARFRPDLILLDVMMPGIDGFETCIRIKASPAWREMPVIFLTAKTETADIVRGFQVGGVDYVAKPFNAHELLARVRTHLALDHLYRENQRLLLNVLPAPIAEKLKRQTGVIAERFEDVSVLFADLVGFTPLSTKLSPTGLLELMNRIFSGFDELAMQHGLEKIKTIGDAYMVAGGLPLPQSDHLAKMAAMALEMPESLKKSARLEGLSLRIGLNVGSVIAGVIGIRKFIYDVWGDTVNTASRLESHGQPGRVHVSEAVYQRLESRFNFEPRGTVELKGRGPLTTYFLTGAKPTASAAAGR